AAFDLEFFSNPLCDPSGFGEGQTYIGTTSVNTNGSGNATFNATFAVSIPAGYAITATATDSSSKTSNFSVCRAIPPTPDDDVDGVRDVDEINCGGDPTDGSRRPERLDGVFAGADDNGNGQ